MWVYKRILVLLLISPLLVFGQSNSFKKKLRTADKCFQKKDFDKASVLYEEILAEKGNLSKGDPLNYKLGVCEYYKEHPDFKEGIGYLNRYTSKNDSISDAYYFLGRFYHKQSKYGKAQKNYSIFLDLVAKDRSLSELVKSKIRRVVSKEVERCKYGKIISRSTVEVQVDNLGDSINTSHSEYAPVISPIEEFVIFTRRCPSNMGGKISEDGDYYEDVYIANILEGSLFQPLDSKNGKGFKSLLEPMVLDKAEQFSKPINSNAHDAAIQLAADGNELLLYRNGQVWVSEYENGKWKTPYAFAKGYPFYPQNSHVPSITVSKNGKTIFFAGELPGGFGGLDLYMVMMKKDGAWGTPVNLGPTINTEDNEESPYIDPSGNTLYFSSEGHTSIGGFDVFKSIKTPKGWSTPKNMGIPVNSSSDDVFFTMTERYNRAYMSSDRPGGKGKMDIYRLSFSFERVPLAEVRGTVLDGESLQPLEANFEIKKKKTDEILFHTKSDLLNGKYVLFLNHHSEYELTINTDGFAPFTHSLKIPKLKGDYRFYQDVHHYYLKDNDGKVVGQKVELVNEYYVEDSSSIEIAQLSKEGFFINQDENNQTVLKQKVEEILLYENNPEVISQLNLSEKEQTILIYTPKFEGQSLLERSAYQPINLIATTSSETSEIAIIDSIQSNIKLAKAQSYIEQQAIFFNFDSYRLNTASKEKLNEIAKHITFVNKSLEIQGFTDDIGSNRYNKQLSKKRAQAVVNYLKERGVNQTQMDLLGFGETPITMGKITRNEQRKVIFTFEH